MKYLHPMIERLEKDINKEVRFIMNGAHIDIPQTKLIDPRLPGIMIIDALESSSVTFMSTTSGGTGSGVSFGEEFEDEVKLEEPE